MSDNAKPKKTMPWIPVGHPDFKWTSGADVQATWRRYGWTPPSAGREPVYVEARTPEWAKVRRVK
jgi:hypothetical protein